MKVAELLAYIERLPQCEEVWIDNAPLGDYDFYTVDSVDYDCFEVGGPWVLILKIGPTAEDDE